MVSVVMFPGNASQGSPFWFAVVNGGIVVVGAVELVYGVGFLVSGVAHQEGSSL